MPDSANLKTFRTALSDALRPLANSLEIKEVANQLLGSYLKVNRSFHREITLLIITALNSLPNSVRAARLPYLM